MSRSFAWLSLTLVVILPTYSYANDNTGEEPTLNLPPSLIVDCEPVESLQADAFTTGSTGCAPATHGTRCNNACYCSSGFFGGSELTLLRPHTGSVSLPVFAGTVIPERDLGVGGRYWLGYRNESGLGFRSRFWNFAQSTALDDGFSGTALTLDAKTWDAEITQMLNRGRFSFDLSGGVRWGQMNDEVGPVISESFNGWGSTVAATARRRIADGPVSLVGGARGSLLYGSHDVGILGFPITSTQEVLPMLEMQLGAEYGKTLKSGNVAFARAALETQLWELPPTAIGLFDQNVGLVGVALGMGIRY